MSWPVTVVDDYAGNILAQQNFQIPESRRCPIGGQQNRRARTDRPGPSWPRSASNGGCGGRHHGRDVDAPKGSIKGPKRALTIYDNDRCSRPRVERRGRGLQDGAPIRIRDIGIAVDGPENRAVEGLAKRPRRHLLLVNKQRAPRH